MHFVPVLLALTLTAQPDANAGAIARTLDAALAPSEYDWTLDWTPFGARVGREVRWNLSEPGTDARERLPQGVYRRSGWLSEGRGSISASACGDGQKVHALTLMISDYVLPNGEGVMEELAALGIEATERSRTEAVAPTDVHDHYRDLITAAPARVVWSLEKAGRHDATLTAVHVCTPPGTRSATQCWTRLTLHFRPDDPEPMACPALGRYGA